MKKTYRIFPLVFILFLFGFTLIIVAPVFAWDKSMGMRHPDRPCMKNAREKGPRFGCGPDMRSPELIKSDPYDTNNPVSLAARGETGAGSPPQTPSDATSAAEAYERDQFARDLHDTAVIQARKLADTMQKKVTEALRSAVIQLHRDDALECSKNRPENEMRIGRFCAGQKARDIQNGIMAHAVPHVKIDGEQIYCNKSEAERNHQLLLNSCMTKRARTAGYECVWTVVKMDGPRHGKVPRRDCTSYRIMK